MNINNIKNFFIEKGFSIENAEFIEEVVAYDFKSLFLQRLIESPIETIAWFNTFAEEKKSKFEAYQGFKTIYLVEKQWFEELIKEVRLLENSDEYAPYYSPVVVEKVNDVITFN